MLDLRTLQPRPDEKKLQSHPADGRALPRSRSGSKARSRAAGSALRRAVPAGIVDEGGRLYRSGGFVRRRAVFVLLGLAALIACASTDLPPIGQTGRDFRPETDEQKLWLQAEAIERALENEGVIHDDPALEGYLNRVSERLLAGQLAETGTKVRVRVVKNPFLNAFALPNGALFLHSGMLSRMGNEAQLAAVLGHEIAHFTHRHAVREMRLTKNRIVAASVTAALLAGLAGDPQAGASFAELSQSVLALWTALTVTGYSRELEAEADQLGLEAMIAAGYDPNEATEVFQQLKQELDEMGVEEPYYFGSHPRLDERIEKHRRLLAERKAPLADRYRGAEAYGDSISAVLLENAALDLSIGRIETARASVIRHLAGNPESARGHFMLGECHRRSGRGEPETAAAVTAYREAIRLDPEYAEPPRARGMIYRGGDRADEARAEFARYLELAPNAVDRPIIEGYLARPAHVAAPPPP